MSATTTPPSRQSSSASPDWTTMSDNEMYMYAVGKIRDNGTKIGINVGIAIAVWIIGNYVFIPISKGLFVGVYAMTQLVDIIILAALLILVIRILSEVASVTDSAAVLTAYYSKGSGAIEKAEVGDFRSAFRGFLYVLVVAGAYILLAQQLNILFSALAGVVLLVVVVWAVYTLFSSGMSLTKIVDRHFQRWEGELAARAPQPSATRT